MPEEYFAPDRAGQSFGGPIRVYRGLGKRQIRLNKALIPARSKTGGGSYTYLDRRRAPASYRLQAVMLDGSHVWLGSARAS